MIPWISCLRGEASCPLHLRLPHDVALRQMNAESTVAALIRITLLRRKHKVQFWVWLGNLSSSHVYWFSLLNDTLSVALCDISSNWAVIPMLKKICFTVLRWCSRNFAHVQENSNNNNNNNNNNNTAGLFRQLMCCLWIDLAVLPSISWILLRTPMVAASVSGV